MNKNKPIKIIFCLPGNHFSGKFLDCWTDLITLCSSKNIQFGVSRRESCNIYYVRNMCLGGDTLRGINQVPFNGKVDYDYLMWIDSDQIFLPDHFFNLLDKAISQNLNILSGLYLMENGKQFATVKNWDEKYFLKNGHFRFMTFDDFKNKVNPIEVSYTGFGFMLIKKGVFESMKYPWFKPIKQNIGDLTEFTMEDVSFCLKAKELNYKIHIDPTIIVGHEKRVVL